MSQTNPSGGFNQAGGQIPGGGGAPGGSGFPQFPGQAVEAVFANLRKLANTIGTPGTYPKATSSLDPILDLVQKARQKHKEVSKSIVDKAWKTARDVGEMLDEEAQKVVDNVEENWDKAL